RSFDEIIPKKFYYLQIKRNNALVRTHVVKEGETLWEISQAYGVRAKAIMKKNRLTKDEKLEPGRVLCMRGKKPKNSPPQTTPSPAPASASASTAKSVSEQEVKVIHTQTNPSTVPTTKPVAEQQEFKIVPAVNITEKPAEADSAIHTVSKGETLYAIS